MTDVTDLEGERERRERAREAERGLWNGLRRELRSRPFAYSVLAVAMILGPLAVARIFPDLTWPQIVVGGIAFGVWSALCAVPQKFM